MMKKILILAVAGLSLLGPIASADQESSKEIRKTSVVESGTYTVTAHRVDPEEKEIYVKTDDGKILELYFKESTKLTQAGKEVGFDALKKGQKLEVKLEKAGKHLTPIAVAILEEAK